jgi:hypothetical protein
MTKILYTCFSILGIFFMMQSCGGKNQASTENGDTVVASNIPNFKADSAYSFIEAQCAFGPRVMNSVAHDNCGKYLVDQFSKYGLKVITQKSTFKRYDGLVMPGYNIIAQLNSKAKTRIMIASHWDSRPWADNDPDSSKWKVPVMAANDGASGVGVMLELARLLKSEKLAIGIDFVCFDAEDVGVPQWEKNVKDNESTWCLGAQYWAHHPHAGGIKFGVLLDMVGGQGAHFYREGYSMRYASGVVNEVWQASKTAGFADFFNDESGGFITDDHLPVNRIANVQMVDIIPYYPTGESGFGPTWHTTHDTPGNIDQNTLKAVGQTLLQLIYNYKK